MRISCEVSVYTSRLEKCTKDCRLADLFTFKISFFDSADTKTAMKIPLDRPLSKSLHHLNTSRTKEVPHLIDLYKQSVPCITYHILRNDAHQERTKESDIFTPFNLLRYLILYSYLDLDETFL